MVKQKNDGAQADKPSLGIGKYTASANLAKQRVAAFAQNAGTTLVDHVQHATPQRLAKVYDQVQQDFADILASIASVQGSAGELAKARIVELESQELASSRPKTLKSVVNALSGLNLDIDLASEFIGRKLDGTPFQDDGALHDEILEALGFQLPGQDQLVS